MQKKVLITATVQSHIVSFHKPLADMLHEHGYEVHVAARDNLSEKKAWFWILRIRSLMCRLRVLL